MVKSKAKAPIKKETGFKKEHLYLILFVVIGLFFLVIIGYPSDQITSFAPINIGNTLGDTFGLFGQILGSIFGVFGRDSEGVYLRLFYGLAIFLIIITFSNILKRAGQDKNKERNIKVIAGIIALFVTIGTPIEFIRAIGAIGFLVVFVGSILGSLYFIYNFGRENENRFIYFMKAFLSFVLFGLIMGYQSLGLSNFSSNTNTSSIFDLVAGLGAVVALVFTIWYLLVKTIAGGYSVGEHPLGSSSTGSLSGARRAYGGLLSPLRGGSKRLSKWTGENIARGGRYAKSKIAPNAEQALDKYQISILKKLKRDINIATRLGTTFMRQPQVNEDYYYQFVAAVDNVLSNKISGINFDSLSKALKELANFYQSGNRQDMDIFYRQLLSYSDTVLRELVKIYGMLPK